MKKADRQKAIIYTSVTLAAATGVILAIALKKKKPGKDTYTGLNLLPGESTGGGSGRDELISTRPAGVPPVEVLTSPAEIRKALQIVKQMYGVEIARNVERIYTQETGFRSGQYKNSGSAGMAAFSQTFPYAWSSLADFWTNNPEIAPVGMIAYKIGRENGKIWRYLAFSGFAGFITCAEILRMRGNDPGRYASSNANSPEANSYRAAIAKITPKYV